MSFEAYKAILKENGLDLDVVKEGNAKAIEQLQGMVWMMPQLKDVILLLQGSTANIDAMQTYLDTVNGGIAQLHEGSSTLNGSYGEFDAGVRQLAGVLTGMLGNLSVLTDGVNQLAAQYVQLDDGLNAYTDGVAQLKAGAAQLAEGAAQLTGGTGELRENVSGIDMGAQLDGLLNSLSGGGEVQSFTSAENTEVGAVQFALQTTAITAPAPAAQPLGKPPGKGGLAHTQAAEIRHHCAGPQGPPQAAAQFLGLGRTVGDIFHKGPPFLKSTDYITGIHT